MARPPLDEISEQRLHDETELELGSLTGIALAGASLVGKRFTTCRFERCTLTGADLGGITLDDVELVDCDLSSVRLIDARLSDVVFRRCKLLGVDWSTVARSLIGQPYVFEECQLDFGVFRGANLRGSAFHDCSAREVDFTSSDLGNATFAGSDLDRARFATTRLVGASLVGARNYELDPRENDVRDLCVAMPEGAALLRVFGIAVEPG
ncbi:MAG TPA: pentapeptide repeat-containing protein [Gaiellales bacterium]